MSNQAGDVTQGRDQGAADPGGTAADTGPAARGSRPGGHQPWRAAFFALAAVAIVFGVGWALLDSRFFVVRSVAVTGTHLVTGAEVRSAAAVPLGLPLIRLNSAMITHRVEQIRQVESAQVSRDWPDGVSITVVERTPVLAVASGPGYQLIDKYGVVVESSSRRPSALPSLELSAVPGSGPVSVPELRGSPAVYAAAVVLHELPLLIFPWGIGAMTALLVQDSTWGKRSRKTRQFRDGLVFGGGMTVMLWLLVTINRVIPMPVMEIVNGVSGWLFVLTFVLPTFLFGFIIGFAMIGRLREAAARCPVRRPVLATPVLATA